MICSRCGQDRPDAAFSPSRLRKPGPWCRECCQRYKKANGHKWRDKTNAAKRKWHHANPDKVRDYGFRRNYGISLDDYQRLFNEQGGLCKICRKPWHGTRPLVVDHDHETDEIRGLLCNGCNVGIGMFGHDIAALENAIRYLQPKAFIAG